MNGSHPKEKYEFGVTDPTPKRNLVKEPGSHPEENLGWENRKAKDMEVGQQTALPPTTTTTLTVLRPDGFAAGKK